MKKIVVLVVSTLFALSCIGCSSSDYKTVEAWGINIEVPKTWDDFEESNEEFQMFGESAKVATLTHDAVELMVISTIAPSPVSFEEAQQIIEEDFGEVVSIEVINGSEIIRTDVVNASTKTITLIPNDAGMAEKMFVLSMPESDYEDNPDTYESIIRSMNKS